MSRVVNVKQDALDDVDRAELWYDRRRSGLGKRFRNRVEHALKRIGQNPYINAAGIYGVRRMMTEKFKYVIYYRILANETEVIAVQHAKRRTSIWKQRAKP